ncbi:ATP-binding protein [Actinomadura sp. NTSP31]|uniref:ATP-binding protein n=1 Tax=Actinomadura sp. NTSP31 TaxID=1735447 RepID=UPI0035BFB0E8
MRRQHHPTTPTAPAPVRAEDERGNATSIPVSRSQLAALVQAAALSAMSVQAYLRQAVMVRVHHDLNAAPDPAAPDPAAPHESQATPQDAAAPPEHPPPDAAAAVPTAPAAGGTVASWRWELSQHRPADQAERLPARARALVRAALSDRGLDGHGDVCMVLISELVTNAVRHGGRGPVTVQLILDDRQLVCGVGDTSPVPPVPGSAGADDEGGRGLALLVALSTDCGWYLTSTGKAVWFRRPLRPPANGAPDADSTQTAFPATAGPPHPMLTST